MATLRGPFDARSYNARLDAARRIHRTAHDGALLALCESYGGPIEITPPALRRNRKGR